MSWVRWSRWNTLLVGAAVGLGAGLWPIAAMTAPAQAESGQLLAKRPRNATGGTESLGRRGGCPVGDRGLRVLIPTTDPGLTTENYPTFWFYLPFGQTKANPAKNVTSDITHAEFALLDDKGSLVISKPLLLTLPAKSGIVKVTLPTSEKPLKVGKDYNWHFSIVCDANQPSANPTVSGWLTRVEASSKLVSQLKAVPSQDQYLAYKENSLWFEHISQLAAFRGKHPEAWANVLKTFGLEDLAQSPIETLKPDLRKTTGEEDDIPL